MVEVFIVYLGIGIILGGYAAFRIVTDNPIGLQWHHRLFVVFAATFLWPLGLGILALEAIEWWVRRGRD